jgi:cytochrome c oxidase accessory protein FixG
MSAEAREIAELEQRGGAVRDGIGEEDHPIPSWWWGGFVATVLFAAFYIPYYALTGWSQERQYAEQVTAAEAKAIAVRASQPARNPYLGQAAAIAEGKEVFATICAACHKPDATGLVGPSLIDPYWKYGADDAVRFESIAKGRPGGMPPWEAQLGSEKIWKVMAYVDSLPKSEQPGVGAPGVGGSVSNAPAPPRGSGRPDADASPPTVLRSLRRSPSYGSVARLVGDAPRRPELRLPSWVNLLRSAGVLSARPVEGRFRRLRWAADAILLAILLAIPWIRLAGEPLVLLDIPRRRFHVLGLVLFPQELFFLWLILAALALALFFFTALAGRLWCGWACPQTVFTDVYAAVARRLQGWSRRGPPARIAPWRRVATHAVWIGLSAVVGFHLVGYFRSPYDMLAAFAEGRWTGASVGFLAAATALSYLDFGLVRQTFCKYLCPYARFQSVLLDRDSLVVAYDAARGEPRGRARKRGAAAAGDCVDCGLCVAVCPTGIDIRAGLQLECIACTQCIDACNGVMAKLGRAPELIGYRSLAALEGRATRLLRPRVVAYGVLLAAALLGFGAGLSRRAPLDLQVEHNSSALYQTAADGRIGNAYTLHVLNRDRRDHVYRIRLEAPAGFELVAGVNPFPVEGTTSAEARVFVLVDPGELGESGDGIPIRFVLEELGLSMPSIARHAIFMSPERREHDEDEEEGRDEG